MKYQCKMNWIGVRQNKNNGYKWNWQVKTHCKNESTHGKYINPPRQKDKRIKLYRSEANQTMNMSKLYGIWISCVQVKSTV